MVRTPSGEGSSVTVPMWFAGPILALMLSGLGGAVVGYFRLETSVALLAQRLDQSAANMEKTSQRLEALDQRLLALWHGEPAPANERHP